MRHQGRENVTSKVAWSIVRDMREDRRVQSIHAGVRKGAEDFLGPRLLNKACDEPIGFQADNARRRRVRVVEQSQCPDAGV